MKKLYKKPEVIILTRNKPEEMVLAGCKSDTIQGGAFGPAFKCLILTNPCTEIRAS